MIIRWVGAGLIVIASAAFAMLIALFHKKEISTLKQLIAALDYMECELQYRMYALPELCRLTAGECTGVLGSVFSSLAIHLEDQITPDVRCCMQQVLINQKNIPSQALECLQFLGENLGRFDLQGQLMGLDNARKECRERLSRLQAGGEGRLRSYQMLGICGGAALIILLI
jgi:stage III sporulation protein AB